MILVSAVGAEGIIQTSGFLVETKKDGQLQMYDMTVNPPDGPYNIAEGDSVRIFQYSPCV